MDSRQVRDSNGLFGLKRPTLARALARIGATRGGFGGTQGAPASLGFKQRTKARRRWSQEERHKRPPLPFDARLLITPAGGQRKKPYFPTPSVHDCKREDHGLPVRSARDRPDPGRAHPDSLRKLAMGEHIWGAPLWETLKRKEGPAVAATSESQSSESGRDGCRKRHVTRRSRILATPARPGSTRLGTSNFGSAKCRWQRCSSNSEVCEADSGHILAHPPRDCGHPLPPRPSIEPSQICRPRHTQGVYLIDLLRASSMGRVSGVRMPGSTSGAWVVRQFGTDPRCSDLQQTWRFHDCLLGSRGVGRARLLTIHNGQQTQTTTHASSHNLDETRPESAETGPNLAATTPNLAEARQTLADAHPTLGEFGPKF